MKSVFVDANVFLRFFTQDESGHHDRAARLFRRAAEGAVSLITGPPVLFEIAWALRSAYGQTDEKILDVIEAIIALPRMKLTDRDVVGRALSLARGSGQAFADAYVAALAEISGAHEVATFNARHFNKLGVPLYRL